MLQDKFLCYKKASIAIMQENLKNALLKYAKKLNYPFLWVSLMIAIALCTFHCWLYWPGYIQDDAQTTLLLDKAGWHPAIMAYLLEIMYNLFGIHVYNLFLLTILPFYIGIWIIVYSAYLKTKSWFSLLLFFPCFIGNIFYIFIKLGSTSFSISWICLLYALTLYFVLNPPKNRGKYIFYCIYGIVFIIALLGRQNAILQIWPVTFVWIGWYLSSKDISLGKYLLRFVSLSFLSGILCTLLMVGGNKLISKSDNGAVYPATLIFIHQIVGTCAPEMDESCFDPDWWYGSWATDPDKMIKLKIKYNDYKQDAEPFYLSSYDDVTFKYFTELKGLYSKWWYAITKYPHNFYQHIYFFYLDLWAMAPELVTADDLMGVYSAKSMIKHAKIWHLFSEREMAKIKEIAGKIPEDELYVMLIGNRYKIDTFIRTYYPSFYTNTFIYLCAILMFIGMCLFIKERKNLLYLLLLSSSCGGIVSSLIIPLFCPRFFPRYMEPVYFCAVISLCVYVIILLLPKEIKQVKQS